MGGKNCLHSGHRQRVKTSIRENGLEGLSTYQVLETLLYYSLPQKDTNELAHLLIDHFGSLSAVLDADYESLLAVPGVGAHTASLISLMPQLFRRYAQDAAVKNNQLLDRPQAIAYVRNLFIGKTYEEFYLICLNSQYRVTKSVLLSRGSLNHVAIYPRLVVESALRYKANFVLLAHNHPGGRTQPSVEDMRLTDALRSVLEAISIHILDHIIVCDDSSFSFAEKGLLPQMF